MPGLCLVCGHGHWDFFALPTTALVRSDCTPFQGQKTVQRCQHCGLIRAQHTIPSNFYANYDLDEAQTGQEQLLFAVDFPEPRPRSALLLELLRRQNLLPGSGRSLDLGCNHGFFSFHLQALFPQWSVYGYEPLERPSAIREQHLPSGHFFHGALANIPDHYDLISLIHVLEHVANPVELLQISRQLLTANGHLLIQIPDYTQTAYDLIIYDHLFHFTRTSLITLLEKSGFEIILCESLLSKEITLLCRRGQIQSTPEHSPAAQDLEAALSELNRITQQARQAELLAQKEKQPLAIMGTAIAASYVSGLMTTDILGYIDESPLQVGRYFRGRPILSPRACPPQGILLLPFPRSQAEQIQTRLQHLLPGWQLII